ncbi:MAG: DNA gyrase inhibitor YacG [Candidatus Solibacter usitatus]|nr:DNA gyrase inhibitor YacG [Candidatus Solibacter usitatus]
MKCPQCNKDVSIGSPHMPFCSERCKLLDLGDWASEKYVISTPAEENAGDPDLGESSTAAQDDP